MNTILNNNVKKTTGLNNSITKGMTMLLLCLTTSLTACGQKSALYLPDDTQQMQSVAKDSPDLLVVKSK